MKTLAWIIVIVTVLAAGWFYLTPEQRAQLPVIGPQVGEPPPQTTTAYKWRDAQGTWQYSTEAPPEGTPYETVEVRHDTNVLPLPPKLQKKDRN